MSVKIDLAKDFSNVPAGRFVGDGPFSGEAFRDRLLVPALARGDEVIVELDGAEGYGSSFLEEAFGGLIRTKKFKGPDLRARLKLVSEDGSLLEEAWTYIDRAQQQQHA